MLCHAPRLTRAIAAPTGESTRRPCVLSVCAPPECRAAARPCCPARTPCRAPQVRHSRPATTRCAPLLRVAGRCTAVALRRHAAPPAALAGSRTPSRHHAAAAAAADPVVRPAAGTAHAATAGARTTGETAGGTCGTKGRTSPGAASAMTETGSAIAGGAMTDTRQGIGGTDDHTHDVRCLFACALRRVWSQGEAALTRGLVAPRAARACNLEPWRCVRGWRCSASIVRPQLSQRHDTLQHLEPAHCAAASLQQVRAPPSRRCHDRHPVTRRDPGWHDSIHPQPST